jgi:hypothetical protein
MINSVAPAAPRGVHLPSALTTLGGAAVFWVGAVLAQEFNRMGFAEAAILLAFLLGTIVMIAWAGPLPHKDQVGTSRTLVFVIVLLLLLQVGYGGARLWHPHVADIAHWVFAGGEAMARGENPYVLPLDPSGLNELGQRFQGYKYLPLMGWSYLPLGVPFGDRGLVATNLLLQLATAALVWRFARNLAGEVAGGIAVCLYLSVPLLAMQVLSKVSTDLVAVAPLLLALICWERRPAISGLLVGLSIAAKLTPGALFVPCLLPAMSAARWRYGLGLACGLLPILPYAAGAPEAFLDNIVLFNALRPSDESSWLMTMPAAVSWVAHGMLVTILLVVAIGVWRRPPTLFARCGLCTILMLAALLLGPSPHENYHLWWLPLYSVLLAVTLTRGARAETGAEPGRSR